jgi:hypothetical protein
MLADNKTLIERSGTSINVGHKFKRVKLLVDAVLRLHAINISTMMTAIGNSQVDISKNLWHRMNNWNVINTAMGKLIMVLTGQTYTAWEPIF